MIEIVSRHTGQQLEVAHLAAARRRMEIAERQRHDRFAQRRMHVVEQRLVRTPGTLGQLLGPSKPVRALRAETSRGPVRSDAATRHISSTRHGRRAPRCYAGAEPAATRPRPETRDESSRGGSCRATRDGRRPGREWRRASGFPAPGSSFTSLLRLRLRNQRPPDDFPSSDGAGEHQHVESLLPVRGALELVGDREGAGCDRRVADDIDTRHPG